MSNTLVAYFSASGTTANPANPARLREIFV